LETVTEYDSATRATVPLFVTVDVWSAVVVNVIVVTEAVTPHLAAVTDSLPTAFPPRPAAPAIGGTRATPHSRTAARAAVLPALRCVRRCINR
jgi:hypothetical protein